jgi:4-amino-4-deoxy-L-arabinose transferase-like glycosyltransferase
MHITMMSTTAPRRSFSHREEILAAVLVGLFLVLGSIGRDPWKADEPYCMGIVHSILQTGDWLVPHVAASPFLEKPPLIYWSAALTASLFDGLLPFGDAARLVVIGWMALTLVGVSWAARSMYAGRHGWLAILLTLGAIGIWQHSHKLVPDVSQLAGATLTLAAVVHFVAVRTSPLKSGLVAGTGIGIAFLSKGLLIPGVYGVLAVLFPLCRRDFRSRDWLAMVGWAAIAALPWMVVWPALLYHRAPDLFVNWLWDNNFDRFLGIHHHGEGHPNRAFDLLTLAGLTFPTSALAALALWQRYRYHREVEEPWPATTVAVSLFALTLIGTLEISASLREVYFLPIYPAIVLLAAGLAWSPRRTGQFRRAVFWVFGSILILIATTWVLLVAGKGEHLPTAIGRWLPLDYVLPFQWPWVAMATIVVAAWLLSLRWRGQLGPITVWFAGATLAWGLGHTLLLPWFDIAKTYRQTFTELAQALPENTRCVRTIGLGESERAMLQYFSGRMPYEVGAMPQNADCNVAVVMVEGPSLRPAPIKGVGMPFWNGSRWGDRNRRFIAYKVAVTSTRPDAAAQP